MLNNNNSLIYYFKEYTVLIYACIYTGWTTYVIHRVFFVENFIMPEIFPHSDKVRLMLILFQQRTCMIKARPMYCTDLYGSMYIDIIQKAVVICLIISTTYPFDAGWSGFYHTGSLLKQYRNESYLDRWLNNFRYYKVFDKKNTRMYDVHCPP